jgi:hypothetical protein
MLFALHGTTYGQTALSINPAAIESPAAGEQLTVNVNISGAAGITAYQFDVLFDPTALSYVGVEFSDYLPGAFPVPPKADEIETNPDTGLAAIRMASLSLAGEGGDMGTLVTITFEAVEAKDSSLQLADVQVPDPADTTSVLAITTTDGMVTAPAPPVDETPVDETPVDETPVDETPVDETPVDETPVDETPVDETPVDETPVDETPVDETPVDETPVDETPVEIDMATFSMMLDKGLNMISLPLMPEEAFTAQSFAMALNATVVIKLDATSQKFIGFTAGEGGDGFAIEGGKGYIVNTPEGGSVTFTGMAWDNQPVAAAPGINPFRDAWAFVVSGSLQNADPHTNYTLVAKNLRTGAIATEPISTAKTRSAAVWADLNRNSVIEAGDRLEVTVLDDSGNIVSGPFTHTVDIADIRQAYLRLSLVVGDVHPEQTRLAQNFPNPFNPETWMPFQLSESSFASIQIYSASGHLVRTLDLGMKPAGFYMTRSTAAYWDGRNGAGEHVASGVYYYTLKTDDFAATRKMLISK